MVPHQIGKAVLRTAWTKLTAARLRVNCWTFDCHVVLHREVSVCLFSERCLFLYHDVSISPHFFFTVISSISKTKDKAASAAKNIAQSINKVASQKAHASGDGEADNSAPSSAAVTPTPSNASSQSSKVGTLKKQKSLKATATVAEVVASGTRRREEAKKNNGTTNAKSKACSVQ